MPKLRFLQKLQHWTSLLPEKACWCMENLYSPPYISLPWPEAELQPPERKACFLKLSVIQHDVFSLSRENNKLSETSLCTHSNRADLQSMRRCWEGHSFVVAHHSTSLSSSPHGSLLALQVVIDSLDLLHLLIPRQLFFLSLPCLILGYLKLFTPLLQRSKLLFSLCSDILPRNKTFLSRLVFSQLSSHWGGGSDFHHTDRPGGLLQRH